MLIQTVSGKDLYLIQDEDILLTQSDNGFPIVKQKAAILKDYRLTFL